MHERFKGVERLTAVGRPVANLGVLDDGGRSYRRTLPLVREVQGRTVCAGFRRHLGDNVENDAQHVPDIAPEASGKHRYIVSHVSPR